MNNREGRSTTNPVNKEQIKLIHILKAQRGIDDELYRDNLRRGMAYPPARS
jgi:hypothetical protein